MSTQPLHVDPWVQCESCHAPLGLPAEAHFHAYFRGQVDPCPSCHNKVDLWKVLLAGAKLNFMATGAFALIGAKTTVYRLDLRPDETKELVFKDAGVPEGAVILSINYTPQGGGCFPLELHGNTPRRGLPRGRVLLLGRPLPTTPNAVPEEAPIGCAITWIKPMDEDVGWTHLLDAYRAYADDNWQGVVVPANIAAESSISRALYTVLIRRVSKDDAEDLLSSGATYSWQLRVMLPIASELERIPALSAEIRGQLGRLRKLRNDLAHEGAVSANLNKHDVAVALVAATFGFHYGRFLERQLAQPDQAPR